MPRFSSLTGTAVVALSSALTMPTSPAAQGVDLPTSCATEADAAVDRGLTLLHNMMYIEAEAAFGSAAKADPDCAMAQWGIAMANFHPLWPGTPTEAETARGKDAAGRLATMTPGSDLEQALVDAAAAFYAPDHDGYPARLAAWADAQQTAHERNPDNIDAAALAALARLATAPGGVERFEVNARVGDALDALHEDAPEHPGVIHYAIHAYDNPPLKERGLPYAEIYDKAAPEAAHALHMPAHIYTRTGDWAKSIDLNRRSAEAALDTSGDVIQSHYAHAVDYMVYGHLQMGQAEEAARLVEEMLAIDNHQASFGGAYALAASPVRLLLEQENWAEAAALSPDMHSAIPWENFPQTVAMRWFAKGLGAARTDDVETARLAVEKLGSLRDAMREGGQDYWARLTEGQILTVEAWVELAEGNDEAALTKQRAAADLEDEAGKSPVTPGHVLPARELLGDMLSALGRPDEALEAYRATLALSPNRARSLAKLE
ncbi:tetratricopeptide repeat protein [Limimaricola pyoseonensis]|uniref:Tetratricopeptide repeat-containing protein n=1 Tax=Limimaricola pyoseonensis TaxID=521013 RepID=A0A1G7FNC1_9RHOB|nr:tetratricopeptide repeat protein [Limimaricola pyoseonensis]SDE77339.1 Tetratricopeptide repeat-containing protein [Limimaricola pyoseonensis]